MQTIEIYGRENCPWCARAKALVEKRGYRLAYYDMTDDEGLKAEFVTRTNGAPTVPQVFVGFLRIGGFTDLAAADRSGRLQELIAGE